MVKVENLLKTVRQPQGKIYQKARWAGDNMIHFERWKPPVFQQQQEISGILRLYSTFLLKWDFGKMGIWGQNPLQLFHGKMGIR